MLKKSGNEELDVPMGCFDSVEVCDIVGVYMLRLLKSVMRKENVSLYRDDVLGVLRNSSGAQIKQKRKQTIPTFQGCGLTITFKTNIKAVSFLDGRFNLANDICQPYSKLNSEIVYINKHSNHPSNILREVPKAINKWISNISCNQDIFGASKPIYEQATYATVVLIKKWNIKTTIVKNKVRMRERGRKKGRLYGLIPPILRV